MKRLIIKIDEKGFLQIQRKGVWVNQMCAFASRIDGEGDCHCGHWCPHFGEPTGIGTLIHGLPDARLPLCHNKTLTGEITDERPNP